jgi:gamma-glutamyltranspeptidase/glutathione hydrolase
MTRIPLVVRRMAVALGIAVKSAELFHCAAADRYRGEPRCAEVVAKHAAVVSVCPYASEAGLQILKRGGNAVDAAVAVSFVLAVTYPAAGNIAGGGFMMVYEAASGQVYNVEYREAAPRRATYETLRGITATSRGHRSVAVPGTVRGLELAHRYFGSLPWAVLVEPAIRLAEEGFVVHEALAQSLNEVLGQVPPESHFRRVYGRADGRAWKAGDRLVLPELAVSLRLLAQEGPDSLYRGRLAELLLDEMRRGDGLIDEEDLRHYRAQLRPPVRVVYRDYDVFGPALPSSGGIVLGEMLLALEPFDLRRQRRWSGDTLHLLVEVMKRAYADRARYLGDPDVQAIPWRQLLHPDHLARLRASIDRQCATAASQLGRDLLTAAEGNQTTHFNVVDAQGNAVAVTTTLQDSYGSWVVVRGGGFLLNNEMTDFNWTPGRTDSLGNIGTPPNNLAPGKRMLSSQTPVIVLRNGEPCLLTGSPGGRAIINVTLQVLLNVLEFEMTPAEAVAAPRVHHQWMPDQLRYEQERLPAELLRQLSDRGHVLRAVRALGDAHTIWIAPGRREIRAVPDFRVYGAAAGY